MTMREKMARAMYGRKTVMPNGEMHLMKKKPWEQLHSSTRARYLYDADAALDALLEPTEGMHDAARWNEEGLEKYMAAIRAAKEGK